MVKLTGPLYSLSAHGWLGRYAYKMRGFVRCPYPIAFLNPHLMSSQYYSRLGWCYQLRRTWHGIIWSAMVPPISAQPKTGDQIWWEKVFADAVLGWQGLTGLEKGVWNSYNYPKHASGYNKFIRKYLKDNYPTPNMTTGSVVFIGADGRLAEDNSNLFWDDTNKRLGIGTTGPGYPLEVNGNIKATRIGLGTNPDNSYSLMAAGSVRGVTVMGDQLATVASGGIGTVRLSIDSPAGQTGNLAQWAVNGSVLGVIQSSGNVGINIVAPLAKLHIDQSGAAAAIPVLILDQADISEGFINFIGSDRGVITGATNSVKSVRVELGGVVYRLALYVDA